jgi:hypothetical protein
MERVGAAPTWSEFIETSVFNSNKVFATFAPVDEPRAQTTAGAGA